VSKITIYDNYSTDRSVEIARSFTGCTVDVISYNTNNTINDGVYLNIKNNCWKESKADWVIVCDIDEFVYITDPNILNIPGDMVLECYGYQIVDDHLPIHNGIPLTQQLQYGTRDHNMSKCAIFKPTIKEINYGPGAHNCEVKNKITPRGLYLLHYKFMELNYVMDLHKKRAERLSKFNLDRGMGKHYLWDAEKYNEVYNRLMKERTKII
jgi:hypothetical protein